jgi:hypothetical protein
MSVYTVHEPPVNPGQSADPDRVVFVRDGFHFWAFLLGPLWMLWRRLWMVFVLYLVVMAVVGIVLYTTKLNDGAQFAIEFLIALLVGFEAGTLRRWTLRRRGFTEMAAVVGDDIESAERRYFAARRERPVAAPAAPAPLLRMPHGPEPDVLGLFPEGPR